MLIAKNIMIVDDDKISTYLTKSIVKNSSMVAKITTFNQSESALFFIQNASIDSTDLPDLILLDINMPIYDGWDFIEELQKTNSLKTIPIAILSSSNYKEDFEKSETYPEIKAYFTKPLTLEQFDTVINKIFC
jgi:CheY-like chemotaxis protein